MDERRLRRLLDARRVLVRITEHDGTVESAPGERTTLPALRRVATPR